MPEQNSNVGNWMDDVTPKTETLKVSDGGMVKIVFLNNGVKKTSEDYGSSVAFLTQVEGEQIPRTFYVKHNNFDLLGQIKDIAKTNGGILIGLKCQLTRKGKLRSDTRYKIVRI